MNRQIMWWLMDKVPASGRPVTDRWPSAVSNGAALATN